MHEWMMNLDVVIECIWCQWQWLRFHVSIKVEWPCLIYIADIGNVIYVTDKFMLSDWLLSLGWVPILQVNSEGKLFSAVLFEWTKRKHVPLPVIALNGKSKFAAIGSRLLFRPYIISIFSSNWNTSAALQPSLTESGMYLSNTASILR